MGKPREEKGSWAQPGSGWTGAVATLPMGPSSWQLWLGKTCGRLANHPGH